MCSEMREGNYQDMEVGVKGTAGNSLLAGG